MKVNFTKDELQLISDALIPFLISASKDDDAFRAYKSVEKKLEKILK